MLKETLTMMRYMFTAISLGFIPFLLIVLYTYQLFIGRIVLYGILFIMLLLITIDSIRKPNHGNKRKQRIAYYATVIGVIILIAISIEFKQTITLVFTQRGEALNLFGTMFYGDIIVLNIILAYTAIYMVYSITYSYLTKKKQLWRS